MKKLEHRVFEIIATIEKNKVWSNTNVEPRYLFQLLNKSHPFVFDAPTTNEKLDKAFNIPIADVGEVVRNFSLPFNNVLYLFTYPHAIRDKGMGSEGDMTTHGIIIN